MTTKPKELMTGSQAAEQVAWRDRLELIKRSVLDDKVTDQEFELFVYTAQRYQLDPLLRQIHGVKRGDRFTIQIGIDGLRALAERTGTYCPGETQYHENANGKFYAATVTCYKKLGDTWRPVTATAYYREYVQKTWDREKREWRVSSMWEKMPRNQTAKCAESLCIRKGWPELGGVRTDEEMAQAETHAEWIDAPPKGEPVVRDAMIEGSVFPQPAIEPHPHVEEPESEPVPVPQKQPAVDPRKVEPEQPWPDPPPKHRPKQEYTPPTELVTRALQEIIYTTYDAQGSTVLSPREISDATTWLQKNPYHDAYADKLRELTKLVKQRQREHEERKRVRRGGGDQSVGDEDSPQADPQDDLPF